MSEVPEDKPAPRMTTKTDLLREILLREMSVEMQIVFKEFILSYTKELKEEYKCKTNTKNKKAIPLLQINRLDKLN